MSRRVRQQTMVVFLGLVAVAGFVLFPEWAIEHPADPSLVLRSERHLLWHAPASSHLDITALTIPVLAILLIVVAVFVVLSTARD